MSADILNDGDFGDLDIVDIKETHRMGRIKPYSVISYVPPGESVMRGTKRLYVWGVHKDDAGKLVAVDGFPIQKITDPEVLARGPKRDEVRITPEDSEVVLGAGSRHHLSMKCFDLTVVNAHRGTIRGDGAVHSEMNERLAYRVLMARVRKFMGVNKVSRLDDLYRAGGMRREGGIVDCFHADELTKKKFDPKVEFDLRGGLLKQHVLDLPSVAPVKGDDVYKSSDWAGLALGLRFYIASTLKANDDVAIPSNGDWSDFMDRFYKPFMSEHRINFMHFAESFLQRRAAGVAPK